MFSPPTTTAFFFAWAIDAVAAILVFLHAEKKGNRHATAWGAGVFLFLVPVLPIYVFRNRQRKADTRRY
jgi:hypothetical protein